MNIETTIKDLEIAKQLILEAKDLLDLRNAYLKGLCTTQELDRLLAEIKNK